MNCAARYREADPWLPALHTAVCSPIRKRFPDRHAQCFCNPERRLQRGRIFVLLDGVDGLARDADFRRQLGLSHLVAIEAQAADVVGDGGHQPANRKCATSTRYLAMFDVTTDSRMRLASMPASAWKKMPATLANNAPATSTK